MVNMSKNVTNLINWLKNISNWRGKWVIARIAQIIAIMGIGVKVKA